MTYTWVALLLAIGFFVAMLGAQEIGHRLGTRQEHLDPAGAHSGTGSVEGAVFALLGLLVAFTFSGAAARFDARRHLIVEEANDIGTAYLRIDLLSTADQPRMRDLFRRYLDARLEVYENMEDAAITQAAIRRATDIQGEIWPQAVAGCEAVQPRPCTIMLLPVLNAMFDVATTRSVALEMHVPRIAVWLLFAIGLACGILSGYSMASGRRKWAHVVVFAAATALTIYVILDLEFPRLGLIRVDSFDQVLVDVRSSMDPR